MRWTSFLIILTIFFTTGCGGSTSKKPVSGKMSSKMPGGKGTGVPSSPPKGTKNPTKAKSAKTEKGAGKQGGGRSTGQLDPDAMFARQDANMDGKLTGDEISTFLKPNLTKFDTDKDGAISKEEFSKNFRSVYQRGPGGGKGGGKGAGKGAGKAGTTKKGKK